MNSPALPDKLQGPLRNSDGVAVARVVLDLTAYLHDPTEAAVNRLIEIYRHHCPPNHIRKYSIAEVPNWIPIDRPHISDSVEEAIKQNKQQPAFAPLFRRLDEKRNFELGFWDGHELDDPSGSWSFKCMKILRRGREPFSFVRILLPSSRDPDDLFRLAQDLVSAIPIQSGHAGYAFAYHPFKKIDAFKLIYALARRFWGIDVEDLNATARSQENVLKSLSWLTLLGRSPFDQIIDTVSANIDDQIAVHHLKHGAIVRVGSCPDILDINRYRPDIYERLGASLMPVLPTQYPPFEGADFGTGDHTIGWLRRFIDPDGWRN